MSKLLEWSADEASGDALDHSGNGRVLSFTANNVSRVTSYNATTGLQQVTAGLTVGPAVAPLAASIRSLTARVNLKALFNGWALEFYRSSSLPSPNDTGIWGLLCLSGQFRFRAKNPSNTAFDVNLPHDLGVWHHFGVTYDGTKLWVYWDGVLQNAGGTTISGGLWTTADVFRVFDQSGSNLALDDVRLYDHDIGSAGVIADRDTPAGATAANDGTLVGNFSAIQAEFAVAASAEVTVSGTFAPPLTVFDVRGSSNAELAGAFAGPALSFDGSSIPLNAGELNGSFTQPAVVAEARAAIEATVSGSFAIPAFTAIGGVPTSDRDILVTIGPGGRPATSIVSGPVRTAIAAGDFRRTEIGA